MTKKDEVDEKLLKWSDIFEELALDAKSLIKDIRDMANYILVCAVILLMIGTAAIGVALLRQMDVRHLAASVIIFSICAGNAYLLFRKWFDLRLRYNRLYALQEKLD